MLFTASLVGGKKLDKMHADIQAIIKSLTNHFVLLYICKNGRLINKVDIDFSEEEKELLEADEVEVGSNAFLKKTLTEINPIIFLDIICDMLYEGYQNNNSQGSSKTYSTSSKLVLNEIFTLLKTFYPDEKDYATALNRLEFIDLLMKKICYLSYSEGIQKKIGCISAIRIFIDHCPAEFLKRHNIRIIESQIVIVKSMLLSYGGLPSKLISNCLIALAKKNNFFFDDQEHMKAIVKTVFESFKDVSCKGRRILEGFLDSISKAFVIKLAPPPRRGRKLVEPRPNSFPSVYNEQLKIKCKEIISPDKRPAPRKLDYLLEGYSEIENLINEVDVVLHLFKHKCEDEMNPEDFFGFVNQLVEVLEYEIEIFNSTIITDKCSFATKYFLVEKLHIDNNKIHDLYSATKYPHRLFNLSFEKTKDKQNYKTKGSKNPLDGNFIKNYYKEYLESSMKIEMETRSDYDSYLSELFPNHDQHIDYMILILYLLAQFCTNETMLNKLVSLAKDPEEKKKTEEKLEIYKKRITILMMCCVLRVEEKLSVAAEKNLTAILDDFEYNERIYEHLEEILDEKKISNEKYYKEIGIIKLFRIIYKKRIDEEKIKKIFESAVDGIKAVEASVQTKPPGLFTINHCRFVYEMINIFISVNWFTNNEDNFIRSFDRKVFDIATNMHKKVVKIPCSGSELIDKYSFRDLMCKYMNEKNTWGNHWQVWLQTKRVDILELILEVLNMDESYPFRDRFIRYYDLRILCRDMMNSGKNREERMLSNHMRALINKYFNVLNVRIPSAFVNTIKFLELLFSILKDRINRTPESLNAKENRFI